MLASHRTGLIAFDMADDRPADFIFTNRGGFASTSMELRPAPNSERARLFFGQHFGFAAVSVTLRKSSAMELMGTLDACGYRHTTEEA